MTNRPLSSWLLCLTSALITSALAISVIVSVASRMSTQAALSIAQWPLLGGVGFAISASMPAGLEILVFALMLASTLGAMFGGGKPAGSAAVGMGLIWDVGAPLVCMIALGTELEDMNTLRSFVTPGVLIAIGALSAVRIGAFVLALRSGYYPKAQPDG